MPEKALVRMFLGRCAACKMIIGGQEGDAKKDQNWKQKDALIACLVSMKGSPKAVKEVIKSVDALVVKITEAGLEDADREAVLASLSSLIGGAAFENVRAAGKWKMEDFQTPHHYWKSCEWVRLKTLQGAAGAHFLKSYGLRRPNH